MTEDHTWAGNKRLIPPGGKSAPSQEERTTGTPNCEARGGVGNNGNTSLNVRSSHRIKENVTAQKAQGTIKNFTAQKVQGAIKNVTAQKAQGAINNVTAQKAQKV